MAIDSIEGENSRFFHDIRIPESNEKWDEKSKSAHIDSETSPETPAGPPPGRILEHLEELKHKKDLIERALKRISERGLPGLDYVEQYLRYQYSKNSRPNTIRHHITVQTQLLMFLKFHRATQLEALSRDDLSALVEHWQDRGLKPVTVKVWLRSIYAFVNFLVGRDLLGPDLVKRKLRIKVPDALPRAIDPDDVKLLLSVIKRPRDRTMIIVLLRTGMRIGELLGTKVEDIDLKEKRIEIYQAQKTQVGRVVYMSDDAQAVLKEWFSKRDANKEYVFYGNGRNTLGYAAARAMFVKYVDKGGLSGKGYTLHCLRHTFASELLNAGMRLECLQQLLGHTCIEMTRRYARLTDNTRKEEYFRAMAIIERGEINGHYRRDPSLQKVSQKKELLGPHGEELHEHV